MTRTARVVALAALVSVALVGCTSQDAADEPEASTSTAPAPTATDSTPSPSEEADGIDTSEWVTFATDDGEITFRHPADWTLEAGSEGPLEGVGPNGSRMMDSASLTTPYGQTLLTYGDSVDLGGACLGDDGQPLFLPLEVLSSEPLETAPYPTEIATVALQRTDGTWYVGVGLLDPEYIAGDTYCQFNFATASSQGLVLMGTSLDQQADADLWVVDTLDDATAYLETDEHATLIEILRSVVLS